MSLSGQSRLVCVCSGALIGRTWKLPNGSYVSLKTGLGSRLEFVLGLVPVGTLVTVILDPKALRVDRDEDEIGLLNSSWHTPPGLEIGCVAGIMLSEPGFQALLLPCDRGWEESGSAPCDDCGQVA